MADSTTQIANLALSAIGTRSTIASLTENSPEARQINLHYQPALNAVLQAAFWNFARKQVSLSLLKDATKTPPDAVPSPWLYEYAYPSDCIQARYIIPNTLTSPAAASGIVSAPTYLGSPVRFVITSDVDANGNEIKAILTNQPQATLVYTRRVVSPAMFDDQFTAALAAYLGHRVCIALTGDKNMAKMQFDLAEKLVRAAQASNNNEGLTILDHVPDWMAVRGYASDFAYPQGSMYVGTPQALTMIF